MSAITLRDMRIGGTAVPAGSVVSTGNIRAPIAVEGASTTLFPPVGLENYSGALAMPLWQPRSPVKVGTHGDSIANCSNFSGHDLSVVTTGNKDLRGLRMGWGLQCFSRGALRVIFNGGVSGETTAQMIARESAGSSSTRKALEDAQSLGVEVLVIQAGINDIQVLAAGASMATIESTVDTAVANVVTMARRAVAKGIYPVVQSLMAYNSNVATADQIVTRQVGVRLFNQRLREMIAAARGALGVYDDLYSICATADGSWKPNLSSDGLHPNRIGAWLVYQKTVALLMGMLGIAPTLYATKGTSINLIDNADFSASSSGVATRVSYVQAAGTATTAASIQVADGANWQQYIVTPTGLDGNGNCIAQIDISVPVFGGSPYVSVTAGEWLLGQFDAYVDDGAGGAPSVVQVAGRLRMDGTATVFSDFPGFDAVETPKPNFPTPFFENFVGFPVQAVDASAAMTN